MQTYVLQVVCSNLAQHSLFPRDVCCVILYYSCWLRTKPLYSLWTYLRAAQCGWLCHVHPHVSQLSSVCGWIPGPGLERLLEMRRWRWGGRGRQVMAEEKMAAFTPSAEETGQQQSHPLGALIWLLSVAREDWILGGKAPCGEGSHVMEGGEVFPWRPRENGRQDHLRWGTEECCAWAAAAPKHPQRQQTPGVIEGKHN